MFFLYVQFLATQSETFFKRGQLILKHLLSTAKLWFTIKKFLFVLLIADGVGEMFFDVIQLFLNLQDACVIFSDGCRIGAFSVKLRLLGSLQFFTTFLRLLLVEFYFGLDTVAVAIQFLFQPELLLSVTLLAYLKTMRTICLQLLFLFLAKRQSMSRIILFRPDFSYTLFTPIVRLLLP